MKYKVFDVIELVNGNKATVIETLKNGYKVEIVDKNGERQEFKEIGETDIKNSIITK